MSGNSKQLTVEDVMVLGALVGTFISCIGLGGLIAGFWGAIFAIFPAAIASVYVSMWVLDKVGDK